MMDDASPPWLSSEIASDPIAYAPRGVHLVGRRRHGDEAAQLVAGLQQRGGGDVAGHVGLQADSTPPPGTNSTPECAP